MVCWCWRENSIVVSVSGFVIGVRHLTNTTPTKKYNNYILKDLKPNIKNIMCKTKSETVSEVHPDITIMRVELAVNEREYGKNKSQHWQSCDCKPMTAASLTASLVSYGATRLVNGQMASSTVKCQPLPVCILESTDFSVDHLKCARPIPCVRLCLKLEHM